jgi:hypothetical protein
MTLSCVRAPESFRPFSRPALVVGHPGHELRVFGWMSEYRPLVHVLTDGSGRHGVSRLPSTTRLIAQCAARKGEVFGLVSDAAMYRALLQKNISFFLDALNAIAGSLVQHQIDFVAGDAREGFNPTHDICRMLINGAVALAEQASGRAISNYQFCLTEWEQHCQERHDSQCVHLRLEEALLRQKLDAAEGYPEIRDEVRQAIAQRGEEHFRIECLRKITSPFAQDHGLGKPYYETMGEQRVDQGQYASVIRLKEHMLPVMEAIRDRVTASNLSASSV